MKYVPLSRVGKRRIKIFRRSLGSYVDGYWVEGTIKNIFIMANIQPAKYQDTLILPDGERSKKAIKIYSPSEIREQTETECEADELEWEGERYKVMKVLNYSMGILNHYKAIASRIEKTP